MGYNNVDTNEARRELFGRKYDETKESAESVKYSEEETSEAIKRREVYGREYDKV